jgi:translation initiation factor 1
MARKKSEPTPPPAAPFHNPFAGLAGRREELAAGPPPEPERKPAPAGPARAVIRYERKGHGGKEVTLVEKLELPPRELERWIKEARSALGCGGTVQDGALVLQGDQRPRLQKWLAGRGVRRISVS